MLILRADPGKLRLRLNLTPYKQMKIEKIFLPNIIRQVTIGGGKKRIRYVIFFSQNKNKTNKPKNATKEQWS